MWAEPIKNKSGKEVTEAFSNILKRAAPRKPAKLQGDMGSEFFNKNFKDLVKSKNIELFSTHSDHKAAVVEQAIRTFKGKLYRILEENHKLVKNWEALTQQITTSYNDTYHESIKMSPGQVTGHNVSVAIKNLYGEYWSKDRKKPATKFAVGDHVRFSSARQLFKKGYKGKWMEEIFIIDRVKYSLPHNVYLLKEWDGTPLQGIFYPYELNKVNAPPDKEFRIEKIIAKRTKNRRKEVKIWWMGWPPKYDSWLPASDVRDL
jgi:hypothetical protein